LLAGKNKNFFSDYLAIEKQKTGRMIDDWEVYKNTENDVASAHDLLYFL